jgi:hypothetical protein
VSDSIPDRMYSLKCPNQKCGHMNLRWRVFCYICGYRLKEARKEGQS